MSASGGGAGSEPAPERPRKRSKWDDQDGSSLGSSAMPAGAGTAGAMVGVRMPLVAPTFKVITIPASQKGALIGRGGMSITGIRQQSMSEIKVTHNEGEPLATITITGNVPLAEKLITDQLASAQKPKGEAWEVRWLEVPQELIGKTIGHGGSSLREMQEKSGCKLSFVPATEWENAPEGKADRKVCRIKGPADKVEAAQQILIERVTEVQQQHLNKTVSKWMKGGMGGGKGYGSMPRAANGGLPLGPCAGADGLDWTGGDPNQPWGQQPQLQQQGQWQGQWQQQPQQQQGQGQWQGQLQQQQGQGHWQGQQQQPQQQQQGQWQQDQWQQGQQGQWQNWRTDGGVHEQHGGMMPENMQLSGDVQQLAEQQCGGMAPFRAPQQEHQQEPMLQQQQQQPAPYWPELGEHPGSGPGQDAWQQQQPGQPGQNQQGWTEQGMLEQQGQGWPEQPGQGWQPQPGGKGWGQDSWPEQPQPGQQAGWPEQPSQGWTPQGGQGWGDQGWSAKGGKPGGQSWAQKGNQGCQGCQPWAQKGGQGWAQQGGQGWGQQEGQGWMQQGFQEEGSGNAFEMVPLEPGQTQDPSMGGFAGSDGPMGMGGKGAAVGAMTPESFIKAGWTPAGYRQAG